MLLLNIEVTAFLLYGNSASNLINMIPYIFCEECQIPPHVVGNLIFIYLASHRIFMFCLQITIVRDDRR